MVITVPPRPQPTVTLAEPDDFTRFHVAVPGGRDRSRLAEALTASGAGQLDGDDVWVRVTWLRAAAGARVGWRRTARPFAPTSSGRSISRSAGGPACAGPRSSGASPC